MDSWANATILIISLLAISVPISVEATSYNIYVGKMPEHWKSEFGNLLYDATEWWKQRIPGTQFYQAEQVRHADFVVQWASQPIEYEPGKTRLGYYTTNTDNDFGKPYIQVTLGYFEDGTWYLVDQDYALEITKHEIGHAMGFGHSDDPNDIMYPSIYNYQDWVSSESSALLELLERPSLDVVTTYTHQSQELQKEVNTRVDQLKSSLYSKQEWLSSMSFDSKEANIELGKAVKSLDDAKKYLSNAEWTQKEGAQLISDKSWEEAYFKFLYTNSMVEQAWSPLSQVDSHLNTAQQLEKQYQNQKPQQTQEENEQFCFLFWCW